MAQSGGSEQRKQQEKFRFCNLDPWKPEAVAGETDFQRLEINRGGYACTPLSPQSNSVSLFCFDLVLEPFCSTNLESRSLKKNRNSRNECFFDNYSLDLFKVTVRNWKEKKLWGNSRILLILNWKKDIRIIIVSSLDKFYLFQKESFSKMYRIYIDTFVENIFVENIFGKIERKQKLILKNKTRLIKFIR